MPRISAEARSAAAFRAGGERPKPPARLITPAREIWLEIVNDRPVDFFRPGQYGMLKSFCEASIEQNRIFETLTRTRVGTGDYIEMQKAAARNTVMLTTLGTKLRLTVQADVDRHSRKTGERGDAAADDGLIGGAAAHGKPRLVKG